MQGHTKQVHVQQHKVPARVEKKLVAPRSKLVWRRKEMQASSLVSSRGGQEGGSGEVGKQDLKMAKTRDDFVDITPPFREDPHALGTTLFEVGDDMGTTCVREEREASARDEEEIIKKDATIPAKTGVFG